MKRCFVIQILMSFVICSFAQESASDKICKAFNICFSNIDAAKSIIETIDESVVVTLPDSSRFDYHYVCAGIAAAEEDNERMIRHLQETKIICETSLGIRQAVYIEIMDALATAFDNIGDLDNALAVYQEGIVKGLPIRNWDNAKIDFGNLNTGLASIYEKKGWHEEVPSMWRNAWDFWEKEDSSFETYNIFPLFMLANYYENRGEFEKALEINKEASDYTMSQVDNLNSTWCDIFYQKGSILGHLGKHEEAVSVYKDGISVAKHNSIEGEKLEQLYGNYICELAEFETIQNLDAAIVELKLSCPSIYSQALFSVSYIFEKNKRYKDAMDYVLRAESYAGSDEKEKYNWYFGLYTSEFNNQQELERLCTSPTPKKGTTDWFTYMEKLANAYYGDKNKDKAKDILIQMVNESLKNNMPESEQNRLINLLVGCAADVDDYTTVMKFAKEWSEFAKKNYGEQSKEYFASLNTTAVGYIKTNNYKQAKLILEKSRPLCLSLFGKDSEQYATELHNNGRVAQLTGDLKSAKEYYVESLSIHSIIKTPVNRTMRTKQYLGEVELILKEQL